MKARDFDNFADLLRRRSGLLLTPDKIALAKRKLASVAERFGFRNVAALLGELPYPSEELADAITEAMTTNETSFFRDRPFFDSITRSILPGLLAARADTRRIRIWCAAVSTGQEAYSLAMILDDAGLVSQGWKVDLIATDLSESAIARAKQGLYTQFEIQRGLPARALLHHFIRDGEHWRISNRLKSMIAFRTFNLLDHFGWLGEMDLVLCRNVLFYLEPHAKAEIFGKLAGALAPDGYLVLGNNEVEFEHFVQANGARGHYFRPRGNAPRIARLAVF